MAPRQASEISSTTASKQTAPSSRKMTRASHAARPNPIDIELPPSPENETTAAMPPLSLQVTLESEGDLDSETDLPTMTPPSRKHLPQRPRNAAVSNRANNTSPVLSNNFALLPEMQRAHSSPGADYATRTPTQSYPRRPSSPLSGGRRRSPLRSAYEESYPTSSWSSVSIEPNIPEHEELEISTPVTPESEFGSIASIPTYTSISNTFPRARRRPTSPLHQSASAPSLHASARAASLNSSSGTPPSFSSISSARFANEPYPAYGYSFSSVSSMPSTPTSLRSRSPSISSLETIEDTPDAEEAAIMEDESSKQRGDEAEGGADPKRRSLDLRVAGLRSNKDRKRWSVCGAERRADFSLEPIEE